MSASNTRYRAYEQVSIDMARLLVAVAMTMILLVANAARAHELNPAIANIELRGDGTANLSLSVNLEALIAGIGPEHDNTETAPQAAVYETLRQLPPEVLLRDFEEFEPRYLAGLSVAADGVPLVLERSSAYIPPVGDTNLVRRTTFEYAAQLPQEAAVLEWRYDAEFGPLVLRVARSGEASPFYANLLAPGAAEVVELSANGKPAPTGETLQRYIKLGFDHILPKGLDHVLFIIGLFLLSARLKPLLVQVTTFTLAHSVTLALGLLGWVTIPGSIVEPLIALSIVFVAVENIFTQNLHRWRTAIVFGFGLLHGLGFAGVLRELSVESGQFAASLIGFNIGVELGQVAVVLLCYLAVGYWFGARSWYHARIVVPASVLIALIAGYWFFERVGVIA
ncbi:HupE/UreJ family protein [Roseovarius aestuarii]|uniref:HupE / UreJ protein n=1 Tax=Roseovarius aestuarii TaxID=475083 RepID=A0A1X7BP27_9RHOB|nr:HupE/UreJ family protein [Roseovarius aestuarii]SMC11372.1 HupE / UreJ protein [Roseovarius aestuarii]